MKTVHFHGIFKEMAGVDSFDFNVKTPLQLASALNSQLKGFREFNSKNEIALVQSTKDKKQVESVNLQSFSFPFNSNMPDIHVMPSPQAGGEAIAIGIFGSAFAATTAGIITVFAINLAISMALNAVIGALAGSPSTKEGSAKADSRPSFIYNGPKLVDEQGYPIPVIYGTHMSGGILIYSDLVIEQTGFTPAVIPANNNIGRPDVLPTETYQFGG